MHPSRLIGWLAILLLILPAGLLAATWHVSPGESIQAAMDAAAVGDTVIVAPGTYHEQIHFRGKDIILQSEDPTSETIRLATTIRYTGNSQTSAGVVAFSGAESPACELQGVTIRGGWKGAYDDPPGGGIEGNGTMATIRHCYIYANGAPFGGGIGECHGLIEDCVIEANSTEYACQYVPMPDPCISHGARGAVYTIAMASSDDAR